MVVSGRVSDRLLVTSASLSTEEVQQRIDARWEKRPVRQIEPEEEERRFDVVAPEEIDLAHPFLVVLKDAWDQPRSLPVTVEPDGSLQASLSLAAEVPRGLDPDRHRWQVTLTAANHPLPPLAALGSSAVIAAEQNPCETFFAFHAAELRRAQLRAVHAWRVRSPTALPKARARRGAEAERELAELLAPWREKYPTAVVKEELHEGWPAAAAGAGLLVVGSRRRRAVVGPHTGPVAHALIHHVHCPVALVPHD
ncbi:universal stress protein [Streptomyces sp. SA15]|uniref:universal stress protein n=1 Tax=Streptomyces sp. SA15 TaxID=934019 RepID=UPI00211CCD73|nr:universal stress protein [Streptomyces sp. SA15]